MQHQKLTIATLQQQPDAASDCPLPLYVIPNHMGINLNSVSSVEWVKQEDGQLVSLTINVTPKSDPLAMALAALEQIKAIGSRDYVSVTGAREMTDIAIQAHKALIAAMEHEPQNERHVSEASVEQPDDDYAMIVNALIENARLLGWTQSTRAARALGLQPPGTSEDADTKFEQVCRRTIDRVGEMVIQLLKRNDKSRQSIIKAVEDSAQFD